MNRKAATMLASIGEIIHEITIGTTPVNDELCREGGCPVLFFFIIFQSLKTYLICRGIGKCNLPIRLLLCHPRPGRSP
jgi:hypothetical protein